MLIINTSMYAATNRNGQLTIAVRSILAEQMCVANSLGNFSALQWNWFQNNSARVVFLPRNSLLLPCCFLHLQGYFSVPSSIQVPPGSKDKASFRGLQGRVVRKPVNANPGLNVNWSIIFSCVKMFFTSNVWCSLSLLQLKTAGKTIQTKNLTKKLQNWNQNAR